MAESASGQDGADPAFGLATRAGKMGPLGISRVAPGRKKFSSWPYSKSLIDQACLVKMARYLPSSYLRLY